jgi:hypothetical protein
MRAWLWAVAIGLVGLAPAPARAAPEQGAAEPSPSAARAAKKPKRDPRLARITAQGRPEVKIHRLELPEGVPALPYYKKYLRSRLRREARRARWGAGRNNVIQFRFTVTELSIASEGDVMRVRCTAIGKLPGGQAAKSHLTFGGDPGKRRQVVEHVLDIVARGVVTRLAELERIRRGDLTRSSVKNPTDAE